MSVILILELKQEQKSQFKDVFVRHYKSRFFFFVSNIFVSVKLLILNGKPYFAISLAKVLNDFLRILNAAPVSS